MTYQSKLGPKMILYGGDGARICREARPTSVETAMQNKYPSEFIDLFWSKVQKGTGDECWIWRGRKNTGYGYGIVYAPFLGRHGGLTHRVSWEIIFGEIPEGMRVLHHCDVALCVRPDHLFLGTLSDNTKDAVIKGRVIPPVNPPRGEAHYRHKLTVQDVQDIRYLFQSSDLSREQLAERYHVNQATIYDVILYRTWRHIE